MVFRFVVGYLLYCCLWNLRDRFLIYRIECVWLRQPTHVPSVVVFPFSVAFYHIHILLFSLLFSSFHPVSYDPMRFFFRFQRIIFHRLNVRLIRILMFICEGRKNGR